MTRPLTCSAPASLAVGEAVILLALPIQRLNSDGERGCKRNDRTPAAGAGESDTTLQNGDQWFYDEKGGIRTLAELQVSRGLTQLRSLWRIATEAVSWRESRPYTAAIPMGNRY